MPRLSSFVFVRSSPGELSEHRFPPSETHRALLIRLECFLSGHPAFQRFLPFFSRRSSIFYPIPVLFLSIGVRVRFVYKSSLRLGFPAHCVLFLHFRFLGFERGLIAGVVLFCAR